MNAPAALAPRVAATPIGWGGLALCLLVTFAAAAVGGAASLDAPRFYAQLLKPGWAPPAALFGPVWALLYLTMALAAWLVWRERKRRDVRTALGLYAAQLTLNAAWTWLFFAWHEGLWALLDIVLLFALLLSMSWRFMMIQPLAGALMLPTVVWVGFASLLNVVLWSLNPRLLGN